MWTALQLFLQKTNEEEGTTTTTTRKKTTTTTTTTTTRARALCRHRHFQPTARCRGLLKDLPFYQNSNLAKNHTLDSQIALSKLRIGPTTLGTNDTVDWVTSGHAWQSRPGDSQCTKTCDCTCHLAAACRGQWVAPV